MKLVRLEARDFCCFGRFTLPLSGQGLVWVSGVNLVSEAADNNGSGKSTLFKALTWGLYDQTIDGERGDKVIKDGKEKAFVEVHLEDDSGAVWIVERERKKGKPGLRLIQPDGDPFKASKGDLENKIIEMVGLDFQAFKNSVLYGQNDSARFAHPRTKDSERKAMLHRILRTGILGGCNELAREKKRELNAKQLEISKTVATVQVRLTEQDVDGLKLDHNEFEKTRQETIKQHKAEALRLRDEAQEMMEETEIESEGASEKETEIREKIELVKAQLEGGESVRPKIVKTQNAIDALDARHVEFVAENARVLALCGDVSDRLVDLEDNDLCPTCNSQLGQGDAKKFVEQLRETLEETKEDKEISQEKIEAVKARLTKLHQKRVRLDAEAEKAADLLVDLGELEKKLSTLAAAESVAKASREQSKVVAQQRLELARLSLEGAKQAKAQVNPYAERLQAAQVKVDECTAELNKLDKDNKKLATELAHVEFWVRGFSNQGLPSYILDSIMPYITTRTNHYLETLSDGDITVNFSTQREMKSSKGEFRDEINISWSIEGVDDYPPSGGQLKKIEIATDLALMDLVATKEGAKIDLLALDEVLDGLDSEGRQRVLLLLHEMRAQIGTIFVISHESEMIEIFERSVTVVKDEDGSQLRASA